MEREIETYGERNREWKRDIMAMRQRPMVKATQSDGETMRESVVMTEIVYQSMCCLLQG